MAVKFERHGARCPQLRHEYKVYRELTNCHGFCSVYHFGTQDIYNVMVMDLLGPSLEDLFNKCSRRFTLKTVLQIADQMLERVDTLHSRHLIHRDIKPANFVIGVGDQGANVYCVDFGLSKRYRHPKNLQHIPHRDGRSLTGTPRYASINNHLGIEQSRRDDLESIGYVLIYFLKGSLPWQGLKAKNAQKKYRMILEKKQQVSIAQLCQGCPSQFAEFLAYTRSLKFDAKPDIPYLRKLFRDMYHAQGCANMGKLWDWDNLDADYSTLPDTGAPLLQLGSGGAGQLRPSTAAAVAPSGGAAGDDNMVMGDDYASSHGRDGGSGGGRDVPARPSTAGATASRPSAGAQNGSWGYTGAANGASSGAALDPNRRPQTATGVTRAPASSAYPQQVVTDPRGGSGEEEEEDDAHVVAGARAMMRYRRTRASSQEPAPQQVGAAPIPTGPGAQGWSAGDGYANQQAQRLQQQQQQLIQQQQMVSQGASQQARAKSAGTSRATQPTPQAAPVQMVAPVSSTATGWMNGGAGADARPKSAGVMGSLQGQQQAQQQAQQSALSYGSLRSRFLSGGAQPVQAPAPMGQAPVQAQAAQGQQAKASNSASKLFSISR